jgi:hypothetical protein
MTPTEVLTVVLKEIGGDWRRSNSHGVRLRECIVEPPRRRTYIDSLKTDVPIELWLVLEERPDTHSGYEVVFDETQGSFGLATVSNDGPVFLGWYGSFLETIESM